MIQVAGKGSQPQCVWIQVQGVLAYGVCLRLVSLRKIRDRAMSTVELKIVGFVFKFK